MLFHNVLRGFEPQMSATLYNAWMQATLQLGIYKPLWFEMSEAWKLETFREYTYKIGSQEQGTLFMPPITYIYTTLEKKIEENRNLSFRRSYGQCFYLACNHSATKALLKSSYVYKKNTAVVGLQYYHNLNGVFTAVLLWLAAVCRAAQSNDPLDKQGSHKDSNVKLS